LADSSGNKESPDVFLNRWMTTVDEISLYHIIFCGYPDIPVPFLSFFSQVRQRQFVQNTGTDLFGDSRQHFSAGPSIEELFKTVA
jgi:hypothetical protein